MSELKEAIELISNIQDLAHVVLSGRRRNHQVDHERIDIRPVEIKGQLLYQMTYSDGRKVTTKNYQPVEFKVEELIQSGYSNITIRHRGGEFAARFTKKDELLVSRKPGRFEPETRHDRQKARLLDSSDPYLRHVGISDINGVVKPSKMAKYLQIEEFLRLTTPDILKMADPIKIFDLGSGSGYLTFAIHQYLHQLNREVQVIGVDLRPEFEEKNSDVAQQLGISATIKFRTAAIVDEPTSKADVVIALHACDTATDEALAWAVKAGAKAIFVAPCCHHDIQRQMKEAPEPWSAVTSHGILKERLGDLITDALRIELLKAQGYTCDAVEFIGGEHTPRNIMIRAFFTGKRSDLETYNHMASQWGVTAALHTLLSTR